MKTSHTPLRWSCFLGLFASLLPTSVAAQGTPLGHYVYCPPGIDDAAGVKKCVGASTVPKNGFLFPLGPKFFVSPTGDVGFGTTSPVTRLDVRGSGGNDNTLRFLKTGSTGAGGILLQRPGGTPVDWSISYESGVKRDFLIHDNVALKTRLRIDDEGYVIAERIQVGTTTASLRLVPSPDSVFFHYVENGVGAGSVHMNFEPDRIQINRSVEFSQDALFEPGTSLRFIEYEFSTSPPMMHMFEDGPNNFDRMVLAHSDAFDNWGLRYDDSDDTFHFTGGGNAVLTVDLAPSEGKVGIEVENPSNILTVQPGSPTDLIADAWTTYSSRRWKENVAPIEDALALVRGLRGVTFDLKATGKHDLGMIAEEVGELLPELVAYEANGVDAQSIDYARLTSMLVEAIKQQDEALADLLERVKTLEER